MEERRFRSTASQELFGLGRAGRAARAFGLDRDTVSGVVTSRSLLLALLVVQALPPPFPRRGAAKVFENDQVVVWDVSWEQGVATPLHEHRFTALSVAIQPGLVESLMPDGSRRIGSLERVGDVQYGGQGLVHRERGVSETPRRVFLLELKENTPEADPLPQGIPPAWPREGARQVLDTPLVTVWDYTFQADQESPRHYHQRDRVVVELSPGRIQIRDQNGETRVETIHRGRARFVPRGGIDREVYLDGSPRLIVIELKR